MDFLQRSASAALTVLVPLVVAALAAAAGSLSASGAVAAVLVGAVAMRTSMAWGAFLILWFLLAAAASRIGRARKAERVGAIVEKGDRRDHLQVLANGGVFLLCGIAALLGRGGFIALDQAAVAVAAAGALCAAGADTWATEAGTLGGGRPWSLRLRRRVPVGTSGAVTTIGSAGALAGATLLAGLAVRLGMAPNGAFPALIAGGVVGAFADTLLGAWLQERRWCPRCASSTERGVHDCGTTTVRRGGVAALDNDGVNLLCSLVGACVALLAWRALGESAPFGPS